MYQISLRVKTNHFFGSQEFKKEVVRYSIAAKVQELITGKNDSFALISSYSNFIYKAELGNMKPHLQGSNRKYRCRKDQ